MNKGEKPQKFIFLGSNVIACVSLFSGVTILVSFALFTPPVIAKAQAFFFIHNVCALSIESGSFYFFTDDQSQFPDGPHFSKLFYATAIGVTTALFNCLGIFIN